MSPSRNLPELPARLADLARTREGYPVPWFVAWIDPVDGRERAGLHEPLTPERLASLYDARVVLPDFRIIGAGKLGHAHERGLCWICGNVRHRRRNAFVVGPMCAVNRISAEPPSHPECATYAAQACPFLANPTMVRRQGHRPAAAGKPAGEMIERNPGVALVWVTKSYETVADRTPDGSPGMLFRMGDPLATLWYAHGRSATRAEVLASFESGFPTLLAAAEDDDRAAAREAFGTLTDTGAVLIRKGGSAVARVERAYRDAVARYLPTDGADVLVEPGGRSPGLR